MTAGREGACREAPPGRELAEPRRWMRPQPGPGEAAARAAPSTELHPSAAPKEQPPTFG